MTTCSKGHMMQSRVCSVAGQKVNLLLCDCYMKKVHQLNKVQGQGRLILPRSAVGKLVTILEVDPL